MGPARIASREIPATAGVTSASAVSTDGGVALTRIGREGLWVALGHTVALLGSLVGLRLLTEVASPALFGAYVLFNAALALGQGILFGPGGQAALRWYPDVAARGCESDLRRYVSLQYRRRWAWSACLILAAAAADRIFFHRASTALWLLAVVAVAVEGWKTLEVVMRNAARRQGQYAILLAADSVGRPLGAIGSAAVAGASLESLVLGQTLGAAAAVAACTLHGRLSGLERRPAWLGRESGLGELHEEMRHFARPLTWLPVLGWVTGVGDRYIVAGLLGLADAGIYSAAYGLASRPLLLMGAITEATLRQPLYEAETRHDRKRARRVAMAWLAANLGVGVAVTVMVILGMPMLSEWLLAVSYREAAISLVPWIASGYVALVAGQAPERVLYARGRTSVVLAVQAAGAALSLIAGAVGAALGGLRGVAAAVPGYLVFQFLLTVWAAWRFGR